MLSYHNGCLWFYIFILVEWKHMCCHTVFTVCILQSIISVASVDIVYAFTMS
uniref:Uncharacterized protein n=1 Tax=Rhizophora mucronata TaxID=61149 RepID=A0A2P2LXY9_RHIMU